MITRTLKNGIRTAVVPIKGLRAVTVEVLVKVGSKYEKQNEQGLSHFLEHMAFKGTKSRPSPMAIFREMDIRGADYDAETGLENTSYSVTTVRNNLEWEIEIMADILFNSTIPISEVKKERGVISEEIKMYQDNPMMGLGSEMMKFMYGKSTIGCWNISGELNQIEKVRRQELINFRNKHFDTKKMVIVLAGNVKEADLKLVEKYFGAAAGGCFEAETEVILSNDREKQERRQVEQGHFVLAVPSYGWQDKRRYALRLLDLIMSGSSSSKLFEEIRSKRGWAYYVFSVSENIKEAGMWGVQAGVGRQNLTVAMELTEELMLKAEKIIGADDLERARTYLRGRIELHLDQSEFWTGFVGEKWLLEDRLVSPMEEMKMIEEVKLGEVKEICRDIFKPEKIRKLSILAK